MFLSSKCPSGQSNAANRHAVSKILFATLMAGTLAACSNDITRISDAEYTAAIAQQRAFLRQSPHNAPVRQPMPGAPLVRSSAVPAPVMAEPVQPAYMPAQPNPNIVAQAAYRPTPANLARGDFAAQDPSNRGANNMSGVNGGWTRVGGTTITVMPGDDVAALSRRYGVPEKAILDANGLNGPQDIVAGRYVTIPTYVYGAQRQPVRTLEPSARTRPIQQAAPVIAQPAVQRPNAPQAFPAAAPTRAPAPVVTQPTITTPAPASGAYVVVSGDTLYGIARRNNVSVDQLRSANGLGQSNNIRLGQRLIIPGREASARQSAQTTSQAVEQPIVQPAAVPTPKASRVVPTQRVTAPSVQTSPGPQAQPASYTPPQTASPAPATPQTGSTLSFRSPVNGRIISTFGSQTNGERNDGINFAVPEGTPVKAAEDGVVIYAGNELKSYGNLVLVRHADGWVTAYAHNSNIKVNRGQQVQRGQEIAAAGTTGSVTSPQLRFELRKGSKPVNPLDHLGGV